MIAFRIGNEELDLSPGFALQVEYFSSLFEVERIPGLYTLPGTLPWSKKNKRLLGFPGNLSVRRYRKEPFECQLYLNNLWRVGKLYILGTNASGISVSFQSDIGDLGESFKNDNLRELPLGSDPLVTAVRGLYPASNYALLPVRNGQLYKEEAQYAGFQNFYDGSFKAPGKQYPCTPFPYLVHVLRRVMQHYGYRITGSWLEEESTRSLVIYNLQVLDQAHQQEVEYADHLPNMKVNEFLKAVRAAFCLGYVFNTTTKTMEVVRLRDVIRNTVYADWRSRETRVKEWKPNVSEGFRLELSPDSNDELNKQLPVEAYTYQVGKGKEVIPISLGTLNIGADAVVETSQPLNLEGKYGLSLLYYVPTGTPRGQALVPAALYEQCHREWLEFLGETELVETEIDLNLTDLRTLRQDRKVLVQEEFGSVKGLWKKISVTISLDKGIQLAKVPLLKVRV